MPSKDVLFSALRGESPVRPAWVPFVGVHGASLIGASAQDYLLSADLMAQGLLKANELYDPDGLPAVFDLQLEAEVLGCELAWAEEVPPSVISHPWAGNGPYPALPEFSTKAGRFPLVQDALRQVIAAIGNDVALYGLITGPFTLLSHLRGADVFMDLMLAQDQLHSWLKEINVICKQVVDFYLEEGCEIIAVVDPMLSQISPEHFTGFSAPYLNEIFTYIREREAFSSLFVCGDATRNLEVMAQTVCDNISIDENIDLNALRELGLAHNKSIGGNLKLTSVLLLGSETASKREALRCMEEGGHKGFVLAPGCDLPYAVPAANLQAVAEIVHAPYSKETAQALLDDQEADTFEDIEIPDFAAEKAVIIDVITLNSAACAPCYYIMEATYAGAKAAGIPVEVHEHKINTREGIGYMTRLGVSNLPTICIDGEIAFISKTPDRDTLVKAILDRAKALGKV